MKRFSSSAAIPALVLLALFGIDFSRLFSRGQPAEFVPEVNISASAPSAPKAVPRISAPLKPGLVIQVRPYAQLKMAKPLVRAVAAPLFPGPALGSVPDIVF